MGIFNRKNGVEDIFGMEEDTQTPAGTVANPTPPAQPKPQTTKVRVKSNSSPSSNSSVYGIEDAIKLMRQLPNVDSEILITVVNKTLESANIKVSEIIADAESKEANIERRNSSLSSRIAELDNEISQLNAEITTLTDDLKETTKVKKLLKLSVGKTQNENKPASEAQTQASAKSPPKTDQPQSQSPAVAGEAV